MAITTEKNPGAYKRLRDQMRLLSGSHVRIGLFGGRNPDGGSVVQYGAVHEFGGGDVPERSFIRGNDSDNRRRYQQDIQVGLGLIVSGKATVGDVLMALGARIQADIKRRITAGIDPPLAPSTLAAKTERGWSSTPLIATGTLRRYITFAVTVGKKIGNPQAV